MVNATDLIDSSGLMTTPAVNTHATFGAGISAWINSMAPGWDWLIIIAIAAVTGYFLSKKFISPNWLWAAFSLAVYMTLKYVGL